MRIYQFGIVGSREKFKKFYLHFQKTYTYELQTRKGGAMPWNAPIVLANDVNCLILKH